MINLPVSEAYAFDYLAILEVKVAESLPGSSDEFARCCKSLLNQLGAQKLSEIRRSWDYSQLQSANREVWNMVGKASKDQCKASEVDAANQRRFLAKKALQERFWPNEPLTETKAKRPNESNP